MLEHRAPSALRSRSGAQRQALLQVFFPRPEWHQDSSSTSRHRKAMATSERQITENVLARLAASPDERVRQVAASLVKHLQRFRSHVEPTKRMVHRDPVLTDTGKMCDGKGGRNSSCSPTRSACRCWSIAINHRKPPGATESHRLGPVLYREHAAARDGREHGADPRRAGASSTARYACRWPPVV